MLLLIRDIRLLNPLILQKKCLDYFFIQNMRVSYMFYVDWELEGAEKKLRWGSILRIFYYIGLQETNNFLRPNLTSSFYLILSYCNRILIHTAHVKEV